MFFQKIRIETSEFTVIVSLSDEAENVNKKRSEINQYLELAPGLIDLKKVALWIVDMFGDEVMGIEIWNSNYTATCLVPHLDKYGPKEENNSIPMSISEN